MLLLVGKVIYSNVISIVAIVLLSLMILLHPIIHVVFGGADDMIMLYLASIYHGGWNE
jgi:hypothetical protein